MRTNRQSPSALFSALLVFCLLGQPAPSGAQAFSFRTGSAYCKNRQCRLSATLDRAKATAVATFNDTLLVSGWGILDVRAGYASNLSFSNQDIMFAAGFLEGALTANQIEAHYANLRNTMLPSTEVQTFNRVQNWFIKQRQWADSMLAQHGRDDPFWRHVGYILAQLDGLYAGYKSARPGDDAPVDRFALDFLNGVGDLLDLLTALSEKSQPDWTKFSLEEARTFMGSRGHCSVLIKLLPGFENMLMSHVTWFRYQATNRIYKHYDFNVDDPATSAKKLSFSSYPGFLESLDDYYHLGSGLVMLQTTILPLNHSLYNLLTESSLFAWQRVRAASMMARDGKEWIDLFKKHNSGTYNNEYMVIDLNKFKAGEPLVEGTLWLANQIPGLVLSADVTHVLRNGHFPSYNLPYFDEVFQRGGWADFAKVHGPEFSYDLAPRGKIFRRDASKVSTLEDLKKLMLSNDYLHDEYSGDSPWGAICSRGDLDKTDPGPMGCYDAKVSDVPMAKTFQSEIYSGPTQGTHLPPFTWTGPFSKYAHVGLPVSYANFGFITTQPRPL